MELQTFRVSGVFTKAMLIRFFCCDAVHSLICFSLSGAIRCVYMYDSLYRYVLYYKRNCDFLSAVLVSFSLFPVSTLQTSAV